MVHCTLVMPLSRCYALTRDKWVPAATAWRVRKLRTEERPPVWRVAASILNKQSRRAVKGWSSRLGVGRGANNSSPSKQMRIFGTKRVEITGEWIKLNKEEHNDLYCSSNIVRLITSTRMCWALHVACIGERRVVCRILVGITITIDQKQLENVKCFKYLGSMLTEDGRFTCEIKSRIAMAKAAFNKKKNLFTSKLDLNLRKRLVRCYV